MEVKAEIFSPDGSVLRPAPPRSVPPRPRSSSENSVSTDESVAPTSRATDIMATTPSTNGASSTTSRETISPEERLRKSRERNRDHSRRSRERKKAFLEGLKKQAGAVEVAGVLFRFAWRVVGRLGKDRFDLYLIATGGIGVCRPVSITESPCGGGWVALQSPRRWTGKIWEMWIFSGNFIVGSGL